MGFLRWCFVFEWYGDHRDLHVLSHSFPTLSASVLVVVVLLEHDAAVAEDAGDVGDVVSTRLPGDGADDRGRAGGPAVPLPLALPLPGAALGEVRPRSEEHTSELQSLMRISYAVLCLKKKKPHSSYHTHTNYI